MLADETGAAEGLLLQLTQLRQLTTLDYAGSVNGCWKTFQSEVGTLLLLCSKEGSCRRVCFVLHFSCCSLQPCNLLGLNGICTSE